MRADKIKEVLNETNTDGFLISSYENRRYISGFTGSEGLLLITKDDAVLFVDGRYTIQAAQEAKGFEIAPYKPNQYTNISDYNLKSIYFEDEKVTFSQYNKLRESLSKTQLLNGSSILGNMRKIKNSEEVSSIKKAAVIADKAFSHIINFIKPGLSEKDVAIELDFFMRKNGAQGTAFNTIAAAAQRSALPHASPTDSKINSGDFVLMDFGCIVDGYCCDITRTVVLGKANDEMRSVYNTVLSAQLEGIKSVKEGAACSDVDNAARSLIKNAGFGNKFTHSLGHGVGLNVHETPVLSPNAREELQEGNVVTVEPGIYLEGKFGVRIEDLVVVTKHGCINLTGASKDLLEI